MLTIAIQAGGLSRRMGRDKGLVPLASRPLIEHVVERLTGLADELLVTTNNPDGYAYLELPLAPDREPGGGALEGLRTALEHAKGEHVLVVGCDMPFLNRDLLSYLIAHSREADVVVPRWEDRYQTMHAIYTRSTCLPAVESALRADQRRMISFYAEVKTLAIPESKIVIYDPTGLSFFNVNSPEDLAKAERILSGRAPPGQ